MQDNEIKCIRIGKEEVKLSLFLGSITLYTENPKESTKKKQNLLELIKLTELVK